MDTVFKVAGGVVLGIVVLLVGCAALVSVDGNGTDGDRGGGNGASEVRRDFAPKRFSGNGSRNLGDLDIPGEAVMTWRTRRVFYISDDDAKLSADSQGKGGRTVVPAGTYENVQVNASGSWTITIRPR